jgi:hypothetical protein
LAKHTETEVFFAAIHPRTEVRGFPRLLLKTWAIGNLGFDKKAEIEFQVSQGVLCGVSMTDNEVEVGESEEEVVIFT